MIWPGMRRAARRSAVQQNSRQQQSYKQSPNMYAMRDSKTKNEHELQPSACIYDDSRKDDDVPRCIQEVPKDGSVPTCEMVNEARNECRWEDYHLHVR
jgi:hypothetical protein